MSTNASAAPVEDVNRGTVVALLAIPVGVIVFVLVWSIGFIASIITLGVAYLAMFLYRLGSGGGVSRSGAVRVAVITLVTLVLSIFAGLVSDVAIGLGRVTGTNPVEALGSPNFWRVFEDQLSSADGSLWLSVGLAAVFGVVGCFSILRSAFGAAAEPAPAFVAPQYPPLVDPITGQPIPPQRQVQQPNPPGYEPQDPSAPRV